MTMSAEKSNLTRVTESIEQIAKVSAVLAAFGYMSLRAHLNYLGISSTTSLAPERYLMELYYILTTLLLDVIFIVAAIVIASLLFFLLSRLSAKNETIRKALSVLQKAVGKYSTTQIVPGTLILLMSIAYVWMLRTLSRYGFDSDVAVGPLQSSHLNHYPAESFFFIICFVCLGGYFIYSKLSAVVVESRDPSSRMARYLWLVFAVSIAVLALHLPIIYGSLVRSAEYTVAQVTVGDGERPICGLLVLSTSSEITFWRVENGIGQVVILPRSRIRMLTTGPVVDLLDLARKAATKPAQTNVDCSGFYQP